MNFADHRSRVVVERSVYDDAAELPGALPRMDFGRMAPPAGARAAGAPRPGWGAAMSLMPSAELRALFFYLTGDEFPDLDEDLVRFLADSWDGSGKRLENLGQELRRATATIHESFTGEAARAFLAVMSPFVDGPNNYTVTATAFFREAAKILWQLAEDGEYMKYVVILELTELQTEIDFAIVFLGPLGSAWLAQRMATVSRAIDSVLEWFGVRTAAMAKLSRAGLSMLSGLTFGTTNQMVVTGGAELVQDGKGTRHAPDRDHYYSAGVVGLLGGALAPVATGLGHKLGTSLAHLMDKALGRSQKARDRHLAFASALAHVVHESLHEGTTAALANAALTGQAFATWADFTAGKSSGVARVAGHLMGHLIGKLAIAAGIPLIGYPVYRAARSLGHGDSATRHDEVGRYDDGTGRNWEIPAPRAYARGSEVLRNSRENHTPDHSGPYEPVPAPKSYGSVLRDPREYHTPDQYGHYEPVAVPEAYGPVKLPRHSPPLAPSATNSSVPGGALSQTPPNSSATHQRDSAPAAFPGQVSRGDPSGTAGANTARGPEPHDAHPINNPEPSRPHHTTPANTPAPPGPHQSTPANLPDHRLTQVGPLRGNGSSVGVTHDGPEAAGYPDAIVRSAGPVNHRTPEGFRGSQGPAGHLPALVPENRPPGPRVPGRGIAELPDLVPSMRPGPGEPHLIVNGDLAGESSRSAEGLRARTVPTIRMSLAEGPKGPAERIAPKQRLPLRPTIKFADTALSEATSVRSGTTRSPANRTARLGPRTHSGTQSVLSERGSAGGMAKRVREPFSARRFGDVHVVQEEDLAPPLLGAEETKNLLAQAEAETPAKLVRYRATLEAWRWVAGLPSEDEFVVATARNQVTDALRTALGFRHHGRGPGEGPRVTPDEARQFLIGLDRVARAVEIEPLPEALAKGREWARNEAHRNSRMSSGHRDPATAGPDEWREVLETIAVERERATKMARRINEALRERGDPATAGPDEWREVLETIAVEYTVAVQERNGLGDIHAAGLVRQEFVDALRAPRSHRADDRRMKNDEHFLKFVDSEVGISVQRLVDARARFLRADWRSHLANLATMRAHFEVARTLNQVLADGNLDAQEPPMAPPPGFGERLPDIGAEDVPAARPYSGASGPVAVREGAHVRAEVTITTLRELPDPGVLAARVSAQAEKDVLALIRKAFAPGTPKPGKRNALSELAGLDRVADRAPEVDIDSTTRFDEIVEAAEAQVFTANALLRGRHDPAAAADGELDILVDRMAQYAAAPGIFAELRRARQGQGRPDFQAALAEFAGAWAALGARTGDFNGRSESSAAQKISEIAGWTGFPVQRLITARTAELVIAKMHRATMETGLTIDPTKPRTTRSGGEYPFGLNGRAHSFDGDAFDGEGFAERVVRLLPDTVPARLHDKFRAQVRADIVALTPRNAVQRMLEGALPVTVSYTEAESRAMGTREVGRKFTILLRLTGANREEAHPVKPSKKPFLPADYRFHNPIDPPFTLAHSYKDTIVDRSTLDAVTRVAMASGGPTAVWPTLTLTGEAVRGHGQNATNVSNTKYSLGDIGEHTYFDFTRVRLTVTTASRAGERASDLNRAITGGRIPSANDIVKHDTGTLRVSFPRNLARAAVQPGPWVRPRKGTNLNKAAEKVPWVPVSIAGLRAVRAHEPGAHRFQELPMLWIFPWLVGGRLPFPPERTRDGRQVSSEVGVDIVDVRRLGPAGPIPLTREDWITRKYAPNYLRGGSFTASVDAAFSPASVNIPLINMIPYVSFIPSGGTSNKLAASASVGGGGIQAIGYQGDSVAYQLKVIQSVGDNKYPLMVTIQVPEEFSDIFERAAGIVPGSDPTSSDDESVSSEDEEVPRSAPGDLSSEKSAISAEVSTPRSSGQRPRSVTRSLDPPPPPETLRKPTGGTGLIGHATLPGAGKVIPTFEKLLEDARRGIRVTRLRGSTRPLPGWTRDELISLHDFLAQKFGPLSLIQRMPEIFAPGGKPDLPGGVSDTYTRALDDGDKEQITFTISGERTSTDPADSRRLEEMVLVLLPYTSPDGTLVQVDSATTGFTFGGQNFMSVPVPFTDNTVALRAAAYAKMGRARDHETVLNTNLLAADGLTYEGAGWFYAFPARLNLTVRVERIPAGDISGVIKRKTAGLARGIRRNPAPPFSETAQETLDVEAGYVVPDSLLSTPRQPVAEPVRPPENTPPENAGRPLPELTRIAAEAWGRTPARPLPEVRSRQPKRLSRFRYRVVRPQAMEVPSDSVTLSSHDRVLDVLGVEELREKTLSLLEEVDIQRTTARPHVEAIINRHQLLGLFRLQAAGQTGQIDQARLIGNRQARVILLPYVHHERDSADAIRLTSLRWDEYARTVGVTDSVSKWRSAEAAVRGGASKDWKRNEIGDPRGEGAYFEAGGGKERVKSNAKGLATSLFPGRISGRRLDFQPKVGDLRVRIIVVAETVTMHGTSSPRGAIDSVDIPDGIHYHSPKVGYSLDGPFPHVKERLVIRAAGHRGEDTLLDLSERDDENSPGSEPEDERSSDTSLSASEYREIEVPVIAVSKDDPTTKIPAFPLLPLSTIFEDFLPARGAPPFTEVNPVLAAAIGMIRKHDPDLLSLAGKAAWTLELPETLGVPGASFTGQLDVLLAIGALRIIAPVMMGPGLMLRPSRGGAGGRHLSSLTLRMDLDPDHHGFVSVEIEEEGQNYQYLGSKKKVTAASGKSISTLLGGYFSYWEDTAEGRHLMSQVPGYFSYLKKRAEGMSEGKNSATFLGFDYIGELVRMVGEAKIVLTLDGTWWPSRTVNTVGLNIPLTVARKLQKPEHFTDRETVKIGVLAAMPGVEARRQPPELADRPALERKPNGYEPKRGSVISVSPADFTRLTLAQPRVDPLLSRFLLDALIDAFVEHGGTPARLFGRGPGAREQFPVAFDPSALEAFLVENGTGRRAPFGHRMRTPGGPLTDTIGDLDLTIWLTRANPQANFADVLPGKAEAHTYTGAPGTHSAARTRGRDGGVAGLATVRTGQLPPATGGSPASQQLRNYPNVSFKTDEVTEHVSTLDATPSTIIDIRDTDWYGQHVRAVLRFTLRTRNDRDLIGYGGTESSVVFSVRNLFALRYAPEAPLTHVLPGRPAMKVRSGWWVPAAGGAGISDDAGKLAEVQRRPELPEGAVGVSISVAPEGSIVAYDTVLTPGEFVDKYLVPIAQAAPEAKVLTLFADAISHRQGTVGAINDELHRRDDNQFLRVIGPAGGVSPDHQDTYDGFGVADGHRHWATYAGRSDQPRWMKNNVTALVQDALRKIEPAPAPDEPSARTGEAKPPEMFFRALTNHPQSVYFLQWDQLAPQLITLAQMTVGEFLKEPVVLPAEIPAFETATDPQRLTMLVAGLYSQGGRKAEAIELMRWATDNASLLKLEEADTPSLVVLTDPAAARPSVAGPGEVRTVKVVESGRVAVVGYVDEAELPVIEPALRGLDRNATHYTRLFGLPSEESGPYRVAASEQFVGVDDERPGVLWPRSALYVYAKLYRGQVVTPKGLVSFDSFADQVIADAGLHDPGAAPRQDIVFLIGGAGAGFMQLPRTFAAKAGSREWQTYATDAPTVALLPDGTIGFLRTRRVFPSGEEVPVGFVIKNPSPSLNGAEPDPPGQTVRIGEADVPLDHIYTVNIVDAQGKHRGRASRPPTEAYWLQRGDQRSAVKRIAHLNPDATRYDQANSFTEFPVTITDDDYIVNAHGESGNAKIWYLSPAYPRPMPTDPLVVHRLIKEGAITWGVPDVAAMSGILARRPSIRNLRAHVENREPLLMLDICEYAGVNRFFSAAQRVANATRRIVLAPTTRSGQVTEHPARLTPPEEWPAVLYETLDGERGRWVRYVPAPLGPEFVRYRKFYAAVAGMRATEVMDYQVHEAKDLWYLTADLLQVAPSKAVDIGKAQAVNALSKANAFRPTMAVDLDDLARRVFVIPVGKAVPPGIRRRLVDLAGTLRRERRKVNALNLGEVADREGLRFRGVRTTSGAVIPEADILNGNKALPAPISWEKDTVDIIHVRDLPEEQAVLTSVVDYDTVSKTREVEFDRQDYLRFVAARHPAGGRPLLVVSDSRDLAQEIADLRGESVDWHNRDRKPGPAAWTTLVPGRGREVTFEPDLPAVIPSADLPPMAPPTMPGRDAPFLVINAGDPPKAARPPARPPSDTTFDEN